MMEQDAGLSPVPGSGYSPEVEPQASPAKPSIPNAIREAEFRRRLAVGCSECSADDVRFWDAVIRFLEEVK